MKKRSLAYLEALLATHSPSGYEDAARAVWRADMDSIAERVYADSHGNSIAVLNEKSSLRVMLAGHIDEIGFQVTYICPDGYIYFSPIGGGFDTENIPGRRVIIHTADGPVHGVTGKPANYYLSPEKRDKKPEFSDLWIDIGVHDGTAVKKIVQTGDPVTYAEEFRRLGPTTCVSRGVDDRIGAFVVSEVLRYLHAATIFPAVYAVATVQEEIGCRGATTSAYSIDPQVAFVVDVTFGQAPDSNAKRSGELKLGKGPALARGPNINPALLSLIRKVARAGNIPVQLDAVPGPTFTDASVIQISRAGVATAVISIPTRYLHSPVELFDIRDVEHAVQLIAETIRAMDSSHTFIV